MKSNIILIKIGGRAAKPAILARLAKDMRELAKDYQFVLVHGGGAEVTEISAKLGITSNFKDGIRMTGKEEMDVVDMVLSGKMNKQIVRILNAFLNAVGLSGSDGKIFLGESLSLNGAFSASRSGESPKAEVTRTGRVTDADPGLLTLLLTKGYTPVIASTSMNNEGLALNINADEAALHLACSLKAYRLIYISDIPGILKNGEVLHTITREEAETEIRDGVISGGMIPKVRSSLDALERGVEGIVIGPYDENVTLANLISRQTGTSILASL